MPEPAKNEQNSPIKPASGQVNTNTAEWSIRDKFAQMLNKSQIKVLPDAVFDDLDARKRLKNARYPKRCVDEIGKLHGPAFVKANFIMERYPRVLSSNFSAILCGPRGTGKTQMATLFAYHRILKGNYPGIYIKVLDLLDDIKSTFGDKKRTEQDAKNDYKTPSFLVIDEFQERAKERWDTQILINLFDHRYDDGKSTIMIANCAADDNSLKEVFPQSILSRNEQTGLIVDCSWPSYRENR
jgi:DNA replication protein DnaC